MGQSLTSGANLFPENFTQNSIHSFQVHQYRLWCYETDIEELCVCDKVQHRQPHPNRRRGHLEGGEVGRFYFLEVAVLDKVITVALCI